jgi:hypothetical protein
MQVEHLEIVLDSHIKDQEKFTEIAIAERWKKRQQT